VSERERIISDTDESQVMYDPKSRKIIFEVQNDKTVIEVRCSAGNVREAHHSRIAIADTWREAGLNV
jgi:hypothetical protein